MLVLSRNVGEEIVMRIAGQEIVLLIVEIRGDGARVGIKAPKGCTVHRREIQNRIAGEDK